MRTQLTNNQRENLDLVHTSAYNLLELINDVLDLSKIEAGKIELELDDFDLRETLDYCYRTMRVVAEEKGLLLEIKLSADLPRYVHGDAVRFRQIIINLLGNAIKFTEYGWVQLKAEVVDIPLGETTTKLGFSVADTGVGIPLSMQDRIFETFIQADTSTRRKHGGTGLGLSISRRIIELMGGQIAVESVPGKGSTFTFDVSLALGEQPQGSPRMSRRAETVEGIEQDLGLNASVLIVEDNRINARVVQKMLKSLNQHCVVATSGEEAVKILRDGGFDMIFMDIEMPGMDGYETCEKIRTLEEARNNEPIPIVAMTAHTHEEIERRCLACGMNGYLGKPLGIADIRDALLRFISGRETEEKTVNQPLERVRLNYQDTLLRIAGDSKLLGDLYYRFIGEIPERSAELSESVERRDFDAIARQAHGVRNSCLNLGAELAADLCGMIEDAARREDAGTVDENILDLVQELADVRDEVTANGYAARTQSAEPEV